MDDSGRSLPCGFFEKINDHKSSFGQPQIEDETHPSLKSNFQEIEVKFEDPKLPQYETKIVVEHHFLVPKPEVQISPSSISHDRLLIKLGNFLLRKNYLGVPKIA
jgi:hypothetical protein